jgi:hypothetical protein
MFSFKNLYPLPVACAGQIFFAWRIHLISRSLVMPSVIAVVSHVSNFNTSALTESKITTFQLGAGLWSGAEISRAGRFSLLQYDHFKQPVVRIPQRFISSEKV